MRQSNADIIQNGFEAIVDSDVDALLELLAPDVEWHPPTQGTLGVYRGRDGVRELFEQLFEAWERIGHEPTKLVEAEDEAVVVTRVHLRARLSGLEINEEWAYFVKFRDGRITHVEMYTDPEEAIRRHSSTLLTNAPSWPG